MFLLQDIDIVDQWKNYIVTHKFDGHHSRHHLEKKMFISLTMQVWKDADKAKNKRIS